MWVTVWRRMKGVMEGGGPLKSREEEEGSEVAFDKVPEEPGSGVIGG